MRNLIYVILAILIVFWAVGFFIYSIGAIIHLLLVLAAVTILYMFLRTGNQHQSTRYN